MHLPPSVPRLARIVNSLSVSDPRADVEAYLAARGQIPGWSQPFHYTFFGHVLRALRDEGAPASGVRVLVCGVYHGLDLALIRHAAQALEINVDLTGVDLFSAEPCADWPEDKRHLTWQEAFQCEPPSTQAAHRNVGAFAHLVQSDSLKFLMKCAHDKNYFDFIYLDTSHDEPTVRSESAWATACLREKGLIGGDDYHQPGTCWGVDRAVTTTLPHHVAFFNRIWLAQP